MSKWHHWDALKELVTADVIQQGTLCKLLQNIEDKNIYEYDCYFRFAFRENQIGYFQFYYYENSNLVVKLYSVLNYGTHLKIEFSEYAGVICKIDTEYFKNNLISIGNWHDGQEYLSKQIEKLISIT